LAFREKPGRGKKKSLFAQQNSTLLNQKIPSPELVREKGPDGTWREKEALPRLTTTIRSSEWGIEGVAERDKARD